MSSVYFVVKVLSIYFNFCFVESKTTTTFFKTLVHGSVIEIQGDFLFSIEADSLVLAATECTSRCQSVRQCLGLEICKITSDKYRCRACCSWVKLGQSTSNDDNPLCKYFDMVRDENKDYGNVAVNKSAQMSTVISSNQPPERAVDNRVICPTLYGLAHSQFQVDPWLEVNLQNLFEIRYIVFYARQNCCEPGRTKNMELTLRNRTESYLCGIYPGPTSMGDKIVITCPLIKAQFVKILIRSQPGETENVIQVCELQVFGKL